MRNSECGARGVKKVERVEESKGLNLVFPPFVRESGYAEGVSQHSPGFGEAVPWVDVHDLFPVNPERVPQPLPKISAVVSVFRGVVCDERFA
jgi:hypothetical protein